LYYNFKKLFLNKNTIQKKEGENRLIPKMGKKNGRDEPHLSGITAILMGLVLF
jgi:hypothetical protein